VAAVIAVDKDRHHVLLDGVWVLDLPHASPLPRVLDSVGKNDVCASDV
jgi:hypothetical protein